MLLIACQVKQPKVCAIKTRAEYIKRLASRLVHLSIYYTLIAMRIATTSATICSPTDV